MNKFKKIAATLALASTLAVGGQIATADNHKAEAYTDTSWKFVANCMPYPSAWLRWRDFNWWEETFLGERDRWVFSHYVYRYC